MVQNGSDSCSALDKAFIGLIGLGYWGKNLLRNLIDMNLLRKACDSNQDTIFSMTTKFPGVNYTLSVEQIINDDKITAVAIASPASTHYEIAKRCILSGKDVFVEKPLSLSTREGQELVELAEKNNRILMVGHILQYHPAIVKLKELIRDGILGKIQYIYSNRLNIGKLRTEENILWSFAPHDISVIISLLGEEPLTVYATGCDYLNRGVYDTTITTLEFRNNVKGHIFVSWLHPFKEQKLIVVGSKAMVVFDDISKEKLFLYPHVIEWQDGKIPVAHKADFETIPVEKGEPLRLELMHFVECVQKRMRPLTDGNEGLRVLRILEHCEDCLKKGNRISMRPYDTSEGAEAMISRYTKPDFFVHPTSVIDENVHIGEGTKIWHFSHILSGARIGKKCVIGQNVCIERDVVIGDRCKIQNNVSIYKGVTLEDEVFCGPSCVFTNVYNPRAFIERKHEFRSTLVKKGATIGANATIVCGVTIGKYAFVAAGAVLRTDAPDYALFAGVPARQVGWVCRCGVTLRPWPRKMMFREQTPDEDIFICEACNIKYRSSQTGLFPFQDYF